MWYYKHQVKHFNSKIQCIIESKADLFMHKHVCNFKNLKFISIAVPNHLTFCTIEWHSCAIDLWGELIDIDRIRE